MPKPNLQVSLSGKVGGGTYIRTWRRFYEALVVLKIIGNIPRHHGPPIQPSSVHRFLDNLAYLCDYTQSGRTTTAIGLEDTPGKGIFWVASNNPKNSPKSAAFLSDILHNVRRIVDSPIQEEGTLDEHLIQRCIESAELRINLEAGILNRHLKKYMPLLEKSGGKYDNWKLYGCLHVLTSIDTALCEWLRRFENREFSELCYLASEERDSPMIKRLRGLLQSHGNGPSAASIMNKLDHLAHNIQAPQQIVEDVASHPKLREILKGFVVDSIQPQSIIGRPELARDTHRNSIMGRMLPSGSMERQHKEAATFMDQHFNIEARLKEEYASKNFKPRVHAEIQVLEHFWKDRRFFDDDRYIGCSKPPCYCCHLYMQHHPAKCVVPQTSRKIYNTWGLAALDSQDQGYKHQKDILNEMAKSIRRDALDRILSKTPGAP